MFALQQLPRLFTYAVDLLRSCLLCQLSPLAPSICKRKAETFDQEGKHEQEAPVLGKGKGKATAAAPYVLLSLSPSPAPLPRTPSPCKRVEVALSEREVKKSSATSSPAFSDTLSTRSARCASFVAYHQSDVAKKTNGLNTTSLVNGKCSTLP